MQRGYQHSNHDERLESENFTYRGAKIYGLSLIFILLTVSSWLFTVLLNGCTFLCGNLWHGSAAVAVAIILITIITMEMTNRRMLASLEWILTIFLMGAVTLWSLRIIVNTSLVDLSVIVACVLFTMIVLSALGAKMSLDSIVIYVTFVVIWFSASLVLVIVIIFLMILTENRSLVIYLLAVMVYPHFISFVIYEGMLSNNGPVGTNVFGVECVRPARKLYFQFVMISLLSLLVWRESHSIATL